MPFVPNAQKACPWLWSHSRSAASSKIYADTNSLPLRRRRLPAGKSIPLATRIFPWCSASPGSQQASVNEIRAGYRGSDRKFRCSSLICNCYSGVIAHYSPSDLIKEPVAVSGPQPSASSISAPVTGSNSQPPRQTMRLAVTLFTSNLIGVGISVNQRKTKSPTLISERLLLTCSYGAASISKTTPAPLRR